MNENLLPVKTAIENKFSELECHVIDKQKNIFDDVKESCVEDWKDNYKKELSLIKTNDQEYIDDWRALKVLEAYRLGFCHTKDMANEIMRIYGGWDAFMRSIKYHQIEKNLQCHICTFWSDCQEKCSEISNTWKDYAPLTLKMYGDE